MIIDTHVHIYPPDIVRDWERIAEREPYFASLVSGPVHKWGTADDLMRAMDEDGVQESWVFGFGFSDIGLCRLCNDYVLDAADASGGRLKPLAVVPPLAAGAAEEIGRCAERGAIGVGELFPDGQSFCVGDIRETWRLAAACHELDLFVLIHAAEPVGRLYPGKGTMGPKETYAFARNHPELRIVLAHWGGGLHTYERMPDVRLNLGNVWYDTAATPYLYDAEIFREAMSPPLAEKILYGSDFPLLRYPRYEKMLREASLPQENLDCLLSRNANLLLRAGRSSRGELPPCGD